LVPRLGRNADTPKGRARQVNQSDRIEHQLSPEYPVYFADYEIISEKISQMLI